MDDIIKQAPSYHSDQEILDARGINMTVEEVAGLPTCKYSERVHSLNLNGDDLAFLKGLRRRIKNRLASQNSRRRSMEHLRRLTRELRAVRACRDDAVSERRALLHTRAELRERFMRLRCHIYKILQNRSDPTEVPDLEPETIRESHHSSPKAIVDGAEIKKELEFKIDKNVFECRIEKLVQQSVNHIYKDGVEGRRICAKTVFLESKICEDYSVKGDSGVLNLCVKEKRRSHGRKQLAPKRIAYQDFYPEFEDCVLDLKIKKESQ